MALRRSAQPPAIDWDRLLDGRVHRLKRGVHYTSSIVLLTRQAKVAASNRGKTAITYSDDLGRFQYLWVQFLDGKLDRGQPCSECGSRELVQVQEFFALCPQCDSFHALTQPPEEEDDFDDELGEESEEGMDDDEAPARPAPLARLGQVRVLSAEGEPVEAISMLEPATIEVTCRVSKPIAQLDVNFTFRVDRRKAFRLTCPEHIEVARPGPVHVALRIASGTLRPGRHTVFASLRIDRGPDLEGDKFENPTGATFVVADPRAEGGEGADSDVTPEPAHLRWTVDDMSGDDPAAAGQKN